MATIRLPEARLSQIQLDELRRALEQERARILRVLGSTVPRAAQRDQDTESEERAQRESERTQELEIEARERALLADVEHALAKFTRGEYGVGEKTGAPMSWERLRAVPWAREPADG